MDLRTFKDKYLGQANTGNTSENKGECVGLSMKWIEENGYPHIWGNAVDLLEKADRNFYEVIENTATNFPQPGDVIVMGKPFGKYTDTLGNVFYYGHTGVVLEADVNKVIVFEQNNPVGSAPRVVQHNYLQSGVKGWIRMRKQAQKPVAAPILTNLGGVDYKGLDPTNPQSVQEVYNTWHDVAHGGVYIRRTECSALSKEVKDFREQHANCDTVKTKYNEFTALGYNTIDDIDKALAAKDTIIGQLQQENTRLDSRVTTLSGELQKYHAEDHINSELGKAAVEENKVLKGQIIEVGKASGAVKYDFKSVIARVFEIKDHSDRFLKSIEEEDIDDEDEEELELNRPPVLRYLMQLLRFIPTNKGGDKHEQ